MAALLCAWVAVLSLAQGSLVFRGRTGDAYHVGTIMLAYLGGSIVAGGLLGALRPLLRWPLGAALLGVIAAFPLAAAFAVSRIGFVAWTRVETISIVVFAFGFGAPGGLIVRAFMLDSEKHRANDGRVG
jgi:hypothetical protein